MPNEENQGIGYVVNPEKNETITVDGVEYRRLCIKTHVITDQDNIVEVACTQKRAIPIDQIHPRPLARFLSRFVLRTPYGIGLAMPETMEMALRECGTIRILFAAAISAVGKLFGIRGWFYNIAGYKARSIDGPCDFTLPPYNHYVVLGPDKPDEAAADISKKVGVPVAITDINDLEGQILGTSDRSMDRDLLCKILKDNPLGQCSEQTPMGIIRRV